MGSRKARGESKRRINASNPSLPPHRSGRLQTSLQTAKERCAGQSRLHVGTAASLSEFTLEETKTVDLERCAGKQLC
jgi:hypothetical protein